MMAFVDGENLLYRFQDMKASGMVPDNSRRICHVPDSYVWHDMSIRGYFHEIVRVAYYTTIYGDGPKLERVAEEVKKLHFDTQNQGCHPGGGFLFPRVFKKSTKEAKSKAVDINITVDVLTHVHQDSIDAVYLVTGDGDYLPLIHEVMHAGKQVYLAALSKGLNPNLRTAVDSFQNLDLLYFPPEKQKKKIT